MTDVTQIAAATVAQISDKKPVVSGKIVYANRPLRAQVVVPPVVEKGASVTLRSYNVQKLPVEGFELLYGRLVDLDELRNARAREVRKKTDQKLIADAMRMCIEDRLNILISGGTSSGKTTFARGLLDLVGRDERIITIEDAFELFPSQPNSVCLKADRTGASEKTPAKLLEACLRMRPDRIIVGELRGEESKTFLDAINTGHGGSFTTFHADTARKAIDRLALMVMSVGLNMSFQEIRRYCENSIDLIIQLGRADGKRGIAEIYLSGIDGDARKDISGLT